MIPENCDTSNFNEFLIPDSLYFNEQSNHHVNWDQDKIDNISIKVKLGLDAWISIKHFFDREFFLKRSYYKLSRPFFINRQNNSALIYLECYSGPVSGDGGYYIAIKVGQNWTIIGYAPTYMS
jgi:hypothetical protein